MGDPMSENLPQLFTTQFSTNMEMLLQQIGSKLRGKVREGFHMGKMASPINQIGAISAPGPAGRFQPLNRTDATLDRRWVFPQDVEIQQLIDSFDELRTIVDPKSFYVTNATNAVGRAWDDAIIIAATGTSQLGVDAGGLVAETFNTTNFQVASTFGAAAAVGLTVAKLIELRRIFRHYHVDLETDPICLVIGSQQEADLLSQVQVVSTEFNSRPVLTDGRLMQFLGFDIVLSERLSVTANVRNCLAIAKSGMYLGMWKDVTNRVDIRIDLSSQPYQVYTKSTYGATRLQPGKVLSVLCSDTTGSDITP
jgi:hypothetical protein